MAGVALPFGSPAPAAAPAANPYSSGGGGGNPYSVNFNNIPWGAGSFPTGMNDLASSYQSNYGNALNFNKSLGNTINDLYGQTMNQQLGGQAGVMDTIANYGQSSRQGIIDSTAQQQGAMQQSLIGRGLGNTTVLDAGTRGINYDAGKQNLQLNDQIAQMRAGYQNQFLQQNTGQANQQANFLERMTGSYPQAGLYAQLAQQYGAAGQSALNRQQASDQFNRMMKASQGGAPGGGGGGGVNPGYIQRSASGLSGVGPQGTPLMGYAGVGAGAFTSPSFYGAAGVAGGGGGYSNDQWQQDLFNASAPTVSPGGEHPYGDFGTGDTGGFWNTAANYGAAGDPQSQFDQGMYDATDPYAYTDY